tara:strand:+ start:76 stop:417 length:342 start_codon:yes stop_codon:yes gene_type:complete
LEQSRTNINENITLYDVQMHKERIDAFCNNYSLTEEEALSAIELLDGYLGYGYAQEIVSLALKNEIQVSRQVVRKVKLGHTKNPKIFNLLLEYAAEEKAEGVAARKILEANKA